MSDAQSPDSRRKSLRIHGHALLGAAPEREIVRLRIDGQEVDAFVGEPIAAAMIANGIRTARTMPESAAPRGYFCGVGRCTDCLMTVDGVLNVRTCITPAANGMVVETQQGLGAWKAAS